MSNTLYLASKYLRWTLEKKSYRIYQIGSWYEVFIENSHVGPILCFQTLKTDLFIKVT